MPPPPWPVKNDGLWGERERTRRFLYVSRSLWRQRPLLREAAERLGYGLRGASLGRSSSAIWPRFEA